VTDDVVTYWAGGAWDKSGHCADFAAWKTYVDQFARGRQSPIQVNLAQ
jgi:hypothetical protein